MNKNAVVVCTQVENAIWHKPIDIPAFWDAWESLDNLAREKVFCLYHQTLTDLYYTFEAAGQTVVRTITGL